MHAWQVTSNPKTNGFEHAVDAGRGHALFVPLLTSVFQLLRVSASLWDGDHWFSLHFTPDLIPFEIGHTVETERWAYNEKMFAQVLSSKKPVRGEHRGLSDLFIPVALGDDVAAVVVVGPFFTARPSGPDILSRWRWLTGRQGHPAEPEFAAYLRTTLSTLVLDGKKAHAFELLLVCLARLMARSGRADEILNRADSLRRELEAARFAERMWAAAEAMIDEKSARVEHSASRHYEFTRLGLEVAPDDVLVGLSVRRGREREPVEEAVCRDAMQRTSVEMASAAGGVIAGKVGDHGVVFLFGSRATPQQKKRRLIDLAERVSSIARRRFGFTMHFGASVGSGSAELGRSYQAALGAAESALAQDARLVMADAREPTRARPLATLRDELVRAAEETAGRLPAQFDRYVEAVAALTGHRFEPTRVELSIGIERVADALRKSGVLDARGLSTVLGALDRSVRAASTLSELFSAFRIAAGDLAAAAEGPPAARQARGLRGALEYIHQHYGEELSLEKVARVSGFARTYFSELFKERQGTTFQRYLMAVRLERAKKLLTGTDLGITRIAELSGHRTGPYLCRVFRRAVGVTPREYRRRIAPHRLRKGASQNRTKDKKSRDLAG
jgi:AraC-like DNA-binding protein